MNKHQDKYKICLDLSPDLMEKWKKCIQKYPLSGCQSHINSNKCTKFYVIFILTRNTDKRKSIFENSSIILIF